MSKVPTWFKTMATVVAILTAGILIAGILMVPYRFMKAPNGYDQPREHWNTKNSTRFDGGDLSEVAALVSQAIYPAVDDTSQPDLVLLYAPDDWQAGLAAAPLLRPLNGILLPVTEGVQEEINRLNPSGSQAADGSTILRLNGVPAPEGVSGGQELALNDIRTLLEDSGNVPQHAILVDRGNPETALLAAPWAAYSSDLIIFDAADAPVGIPLYALGDVQAEGATLISAASPAALAVKFAAYQDPNNSLFGWGMNADTTTGYRAYTLARPDMPGMALLSANLAVRGKIGPLMWAEERRLPEVINSYFWSQRAAFWVTPSEGPFHHFWVLGDTKTISFPSQAQADYAVEIGPYLGKGIGMSGIDMLAAAWVVLGIASAAWILFHQAKFLKGQMWVMRLAWPLLALMMGPFGILLYYLAYKRPVVRHGKMVLWDRPLWMQGMVATASAVGFGASLMIVSGFIATFFGIPLIPNGSDLFFFGTPMILVMILNYVVAILVSWLVFQTPMLAMFYDLPYRKTLPRSFPMVLLSMTAAAAAMNPGMWWLMMMKIPMMPTEESILWFGVMFFTGFLAFLLAWPLNYTLIRAYHKSGLM